VLVIHKLFFILHVAVIIHIYAFEVWQGRASSRPKNRWIPALKGMAKCSGNTR